MNKGMTKRALFWACVTVVSIGLLLQASIATADSADNQELDLGAYRGKVVVLDFWASWCVPCRRSFPWLNAMQEKYGTDDLVILGVNVDKERAKAGEFLRRYPASFRIFYDPDATLAKQFEVQGMPSSFVIGADGQVKAHHLGFKVKRQHEYEAAIIAALEGNTE